MRRLAACALLLALLTPGWASAHTVNYRVENRGISARIFYAGDKPARYSAYEIFGPGDTIAHQKGRSDKNGFISFLPDRAGKWVIKVYGESEHGPHGAQIEVDVNASLDMTAFHLPLVAQYTKAFVGVSLILALFGVWALARGRVSTKWSRSG